MKESNVSLFTEEQAVKLQRFSKLIHCGNNAERKYNQSASVWVKNVASKFRHEAFDIYYNNPELREPANDIMKAGQQRIERENIRKQKEVKQLETVYQK